MNLITLKEGDSVLLERRLDPVSKDHLKVGDQVVVCKSCKLVFLASSWEFLGEKHCNQSSTDEQLPKGVLPMSITKTEIGNLLKKFRKTSNTRDMGCITLPSFFASVFYFMLAARFEAPLYMWGIPPLAWLTMYLMYLFRDKIVSWEADVVKTKSKEFVFSSLARIEVSITGIPNKSDVEIVFKDYERVQFTYKAILSKTERLRLYQLLLEASENVVISVYSPWIDKDYLKGLSDSSRILIAS